MTCLLLGVGPQLGRCKCHGRRACVNGVLAARTVTVVTRRARQTRGFFQDKQFQVPWTSSLLRSGSCIPSGLPRVSRSIAPPSMKRSLSLEPQSIPLHTRAPDRHHPGSTKRCLFVAEMISFARAPPARSDRPQVPRHRGTGASNSPSTTSRRRGTGRGAEVIAASAPYL